MNEKLRAIAQSYIGMKPEDKGCKNWAEMQQKMADELENMVNNNHDSNSKNLNFNTKSFLMGYFYAAFQAYNYYEKHSAISPNNIDYVLHQIQLHTINGGELTVGINRGIAPLGGNVPFAFTNLDKSLFDVVHLWTTPEIWNHLKTQCTDDLNEVRMTLDTLLSVINFFGGLDIEKMKIK